MLHQQRVEDLADPVLLTESSQDDHPIDNLRLDNRVYMRVQLLLHEEGLWLWCIYVAIILTLLNHQFLDLWLSSVDPSLLRLDLELKVLMLLSGIRVRLFNWNQLLLQWFQLTISVSDLSPILLLLGLSLVGEVLFDHFSVQLREVFDFDLIILSDLLIWRSAGYLYFFLLIFIFSCFFRAWIHSKIWLEFHIFEFDYNFSFKFYGT